MSALMRRDIEPEEPSESVYLPTRHSMTKPGKVSLNWFTLISAVTLTLVASTITFAFVQRAVLSAPSLPALIALETPSLANLALPSNLQSERRLGFLNVTGEVVNQTNNPLIHVEAVVELVDSVGKVVQTSSNLVEFDPLPARGKSGFSISLPDNTSALSYRVQFREMLGRNLN